MSGVVTDAGRRVSEAVNAALLAGGMGKWVACRLSDGLSDGNVYDTKRHAMLFALYELNLLHESQAVYIKVPPGGMAAEHGQPYLDVNRKLYDSGMRISDPEYSAILPYRLEEYNIFMKGK